ncbi:MAG: hypothetical protein AUK34_03980 [Ignavibacteria bacterium CG2_30_36_16]|nr:MAG: hypothetical protein AUK34_03980 [Ignavibacteria bacterium CG2_30_36_16]
MRSFMIRYLVAVLFLFVSFMAVCQDQPEADMMKAWQEYMTPGEMHQMLSNMVGEWNSEITMWMDPSQEPTKSTGTSEIKAIFDGRYFQAEHKSTMMNMPMTGYELSGYDNAKKKFFSTWIDNFGTGIMYLEGSYDSDSKTITYKGVSTDPLGNDVKVRETVNYIDKDNVYFEMFMEQSGQEFKSMEIKFKRKL